MALSKLILMQEAKMNNINLSVLFLTTDMPIWLGIVLAVVGLVIGLAVLAVYKMTAEKKVGSAKERVRAIEEEDKQESEAV
jgi:uncharacterized integral membrane protein